MQIIGEFLVRCIQINCSCSNNPTNTTDTTKHKLMMGFGIMCNQARDNKVVNKVCGL